MNPHWLKLIRHHQRRHKLALTLPFMVGALRQPVGADFAHSEEAYRALVDLLTCFRDEAPDSETVRICTCPDLAQPVATITRIEYHPGYARWGVAKPERVPLDIQPPYRPDGALDLDHAAQLLWPHVSSAIDSGRFSYVKTEKTYRSFDEADLSFITDALAYDEENEL